MRTALAMLLVLSVGCGNNAYRVTGPDGRQGWAVQCSGGRNMCLWQAGKRCPKGYEVADRNHEEGFSASRVGETAVASTHSSNEMLIYCRD